MLFIGVAIIVAAGIVILVSTDASGMLGLSEGQLMQLVPMVIILIVIAGGMFSRRHRLGTLLGGAALWVAIFGAVFIGYTYREDISLVASRVFGELVPGAATVDAERGTALFRGGRDGHFQVNASINGAEIRTIFDTGASAIVLTEADARRAGYDPSALSYTVSVSTANGTGRAAAVTLDRVEVGGIVRNNVRAFVAERDALETSLLGMTYLSTLSRYAVSGNSLELVD
jgi:aspartyl protease family protein